MGRRTAYSGSTIGNEMEQAISRINHWQQVAVATMTSYEPSTQATIAMMFDPSVIEKATAARGIVHPNTHHVEYQLTSTIDVTEKKVRIGIDYTQQKSCPIMPVNCTPQFPQVQRLQLAVQEVERIYRQYEEVKGVLRWLNSHASLNAIRAYFPAILRLCPEAFRHLQDTPTRYQEPYGIENWLQVLRDAGNTVAGAQLLPGDVKKRDRKTMWLCFETLNVHVRDTFYATDYIVFNL